MLNKLSIIRLKHLGEKRVKCYLRELPCVTKEETMDSTDSALDEIVSSILHEFLSVYIQDFQQVPDFFFQLGIQLRF